MNQQHHGMDLDRTTLTHGVDLLVALAFHIDPAHINRKQFGKNCANFCFPIPKPRLLQNHRCVQISHNPAQLMDSPDRLQEKDPGISGFVPRVVIRK